MGFWKLQAHDSCERAKNSATVLGKINPNDLMLCFIIRNINKIVLCHQQQALNEAQTKTGKNNMMEEGRGAADT